MTPFEQNLKKALTRQQPSADFAERLFARIEQERAAKPIPWWQRIVRRPPKRIWALAPVCVLIGLTSGTLLYTQHQRTIQGEHAKQQLLLALRITGSKLQATQRQVREVESEKQPNQKDNVRRLL